MPQMTKIHLELQHKFTQLRLEGNSRTWMSTHPLTRIEKCIDPNNANSKIIKDSISKSGQYLLSNLMEMVGFNISFQLHNNRVVIFNNSNADWEPIIAKVEGMLQYLHPTTKFERHQTMSHQMKLIYRPLMISIPWRFATTFSMIGEADHPVLANCNKNIDEAEQEAISSYPEEAKHFHLMLREAFNGFNIEFAIHQFELMISSTATKDSQILETVRACFLRSYPEKGFDSGLINLAD